MQMHTHSEQRCHGGTFGVYGHRSEALGGLDARYAVFIPEGRGISVLLRANRAAGPHL